MAQLFRSETERILTSNPRLLTSHITNSQRSPMTYSRFTIAILTLLVIALIVAASSVSNIVMFHSLPDR